MVEVMLLKVVEVVDVHGQRSGDGIHCMGYR